MPRISNIEMLQKNEQPTLSIRTRTQVEKLPALIGKSYGEMAAYLRKSGLLLADVPFVAYHNFDMQDLDVEIGFPLPEQLPGAGEIKAGHIPAGKVVFCMYRGPYGEIEPTYIEMAICSRCPLHFFNLPPRISAPGNFFIKSGRLPSRSA